MLEKTNGTGGGKDLQSREGAMWEAALRSDQFLALVAVAYHSSLRTTGKSFQSPQIEENLQTHPRDPSLSPRDIQEPAG